MKNESKQYLYSVLRQTWMELRTLGGKAFRVLQKTPLPRVLVFLLGLAILLTIVPLMLTLFVVFMLIKLLVLMVVMNRSRSRPDMPQQASAWRQQDFEDVEIIEVRKLPEQRR